MDTTKSDFFFQDDEGQTALHYGKQCMSIFCLLIIFVMQTEKNSMLDNHMCGRSKYLITDG